MDSNTVHELANLLYPHNSRTEYLDPFLRSAVVKFCDLLEPFIPKWVDVEDDLPEKGEEYQIMVRLDNGNIARTTAYLNEQGEWYMYAPNSIKLKLYPTHWQPMPSTTHPYEALLNKLLNSK